MGLDADDIPVAHTPDGGYGDEKPPPILADCTEPLVQGAPDLRGMWEVTTAEVDGQPGPPQMIGVVQRIEQCGDRVVVTSGGVIHDMWADGTVENGINDVHAIDYTTPLSAVATFEDGVHMLRIVGTEIEVTRVRESDADRGEDRGRRARYDTPVPKQDAVGVASLTAARARRGPSCGR